MADVFISYDGNSAESIVRQISETLERDGISCWYMGRDMEKDALRGVITKAIRDCRVFLLVLNENALKSAYVQSEIALVMQGFGDNRKRELVAFRVDSDVSVEARLDAFLEQLRARDDFPSTFGQFRIVDACPPDAQHIADLLLLSIHFHTKRKKNRKWTFVVGYSLFHTKRKWACEVGPYNPLHAQALKPVLSVLAAVVGKAGEGLAELSKTLGKQTDD